MRPIVVVESQVPLQRAVELQTSSEVSPTKGHTPVLVKDRALQAFDGGIVKCCGWQESASQRFQAASFISPSMNGTPSMTWVMSL